MGSLILITNKLWQLVVFNGLIQSLISQKQSNKLVDTNLKLGESTWMTQIDINFEIIILTRHKKLIIDKYDT